MKEMKCTKLVQNENEIYKAAFKAFDMHIYYGLEVLSIFILFFYLKSYFFRTELPNTEDKKLMP